MKRRKIIWSLGLISILLILSIFVGKKSWSNPFYKVGQQIDSENGVSVYYNGGVNNVEGRNLTEDGYNLGLKYQCVEFVKRYYHEHLNHKMTNSYGHAKDFYNGSLKDGEFNKDRNLIQFTNPSSTKPQVNDLLIFRPTVFNEFGHVAIVSAVKEDEIEIIQQNAGAFSSSRETFSLNKGNGKWRIEELDTVGWLRK